MRTIQSVDFPGEARTVAAGTTIFRVDDPPDCMYSLVEGEVDILIKGVIVDTIHAGGVFGEMAVIEGDRRAATAVARTDVRLVPLDEQQFRELVQRSPAFAMRMMRVLSDRVRRLNAKLSKDPRP
jgi:CRP-like cAMP-binding protein